jgi:hypothetical protein
MIVAQAVTASHPQHQSYVNGVEKRKTYVITKVLTGLS